MKGEVHFQKNLNRFVRVLSLLTLHVCMYRTYTYVMYDVQDILGIVDRMYTCMPTDIPGHVLHC